MPAVLVTRLTLLCRTWHLFLNDGCHHHLYRFCLPTERWPNWVGLGGFGSVIYRDRI